MKKYLKIIYVLFFCLLTIINSKTVSADGIFLNKSTLSLGIGYSDTLKYTLPEGTSNSNIIWTSSNPSVASVINGKITGISEGVSIITATVGRQSATCKVTITSSYIPITEIILNKSNLSLLVGKSETLIKTIKPSNATNMDISWTSTNPNIATVDASGTVTAKSVGTAIITVSAQGQSATCKITVTDTVPLKNISINKTSITIKEKATDNLSITYTPSNASNKKVTWKSSNDKIVKVDSSGKITGIAPGTATITAISNEGGYVSTCKVTVEEISKKVTSIELDKKELSLSIGEKAKLKVTIKPNYAENKKVTWESSDETVAIIENDEIIALKPGKSEIKVISEDGSYEAICQLTVTSPPVTRIAFLETEQEIYVDSEITLNPITEPANSVLEEPIWTSTDETIATVENGIVKALSIGETTITVSNQDKTTSASIKIKVIAKPKEKLNINIDGYKLNFDPTIKNYTIEIKDDNRLTIKTNIDEKNVIINGNKNLKNGSIITITINEEEKVTYVINIKKKGNYTIYFIAVISILLLLNLIRIMIKNKKKK